MLWSARSRTTLRHPPPRLQGTSIRTGRRPQIPSMTQGHPRRPSSLCAQPNTFFLVGGDRPKVKRLCKKSPSIPGQKEASFKINLYHSKIKVFFQQENSCFTHGEPVQLQQAEKKRTSRQFPLSPRPETREKGGLTLAKSPMPALYVARLPIVGAASPSKEKTHE